MIYTATKQDLGEIIKLAMNIPKEFSFENFPEEDILSVTEYVTENWKLTPIFVYKNPEGEILGFIGTALVQFWWSPTEVISDYAFYVKPEHRSLKITNALLKAFRDFARINKMSAISQFVASERLEAKQKLFERQGFKISGFMATYGV